MGAVLGGRDEENVATVALPDIHQLPWSSGGSEGHADHGCARIIISPSKVIPPMRGNVRLTALVDQLDNLRKALFYAEEHAAIGGRRRNVYYRVVDLHHSEATLEVEPWRLM